MIYFNAISIFIFKINPLKVEVIWFTSRSQTFKIPRKYDLFSLNTKIFYRFDYKVGRKLSQVMWFECFKSLTHINYALCMYRWECWWKCLQMLWYFKVLEDCNTFIIFWNIQANRDPYIELEIYGILSILISNGQGWIVLSHIPSVNFHPLY
jgi:hypothetical protein